MFFPLFPLVLLLKDETFKVIFKHCVMPRPQRKKAKVGSLNIGREEAVGVRAVARGASRYSPQRKTHF